MLLCATTARSTQRAPFLVAGLPAENVHRICRAVGQQRVQLKVLLLVFSVAHKKESAESRFEPEFLLFGSYYTCLACDMGRICRLLAGMPKQQQRQQWRGHGHA
jgi:hypothetical protein